MIASTGILSRLRSIRGVLAALRHEKSGLALIEFAYSLPILLMMGLLGTEAANMAKVTMQVNQIAMGVADNASRIGEAQLVQRRRVYEADFNDIFLGAEIQGGSLDIYKHGRIVMSSLQNEDDEQTIFWQRCMGEKEFTSPFGAEEDVVENMGPAGAEVTAPEDEAVIYVEMVYDYQPLIENLFNAGLFQNGRTISARAAFNVRDDRNLGQVYDRTGNDPVASCDQFVSGVDELDS